MSTWCTLNIGTECTRSLQHIFLMAVQRARPSRSLPCRETRWWKSIASPRSPASERQRSFVHATQLEVEPAWFSRQRGGDHRLDLFRFDSVWFDPVWLDSGATQAFCLDSWGRKRDGKRLWRERQSLRRTRRNYGD